MYVLWKDNILIKGPNEWSKKSFDRAIFEKGGTVEVSQGEPENSYTDLGEGFKVYKITDHQIPDYNRLTEMLYGPFFTLSESGAILEMRKKQFDLSDIKNSVCDRLAEFRFAREEEGTTVTLGDNTVYASTSREGKKVYYNAKSSAMNNVNWKFPMAVVVNVDDQGESTTTITQATWITLTADDIDTIITAIESHVQGWFDWEKATADEFHALTTVDAVIEKCNEMSFIDFKQ